MAAVFEFMMDYETFAKAVREQDQQEISRYSEYLLPRIKSYLKAVFGAPDDFAEEATHTAFIEICRKCREEDCRLSGDFFNYILITARNNYYKLLKTEGRYETMDEEEYAQERIAPEEQVNQLVEKEYKQVIRECIKQLSRRPRNFILYVMKYPHYSPADIAEAFDMTEGSVRSTKTKLMRWLKECFEENRLD